MNDCTDFIQQYIQESINTKQRLLDSEQQIASLNNLISMADAALSRGGTLFFCGNGGSYSDSLHLTAEFVGRFKQNRHAIAAHCLGANGSALTAIANDLDFNDIFARELQALGSEKDMLIALSTSGRSSNIIATVRVAQALAIPTFCLLGKDGGPLGSMCASSLIVPSDDTAHIQEAHITIGHILCDVLERRFM